MSEVRSNIIIVDDDSEDVELLSRGLKGASSNYDIVHLSNGLNLLDELEKRATGLSGRLPDLILLDLQMPVMGGEETLAAVKSDNRFRSIPVIILSSTKSQRDIDALYQLGANSFLSKPDSLEGYSKATRLIDSYWLQLSQLPRHLS
ncbi:response regulator [Pelagicoccus sp. SDUM812002]|uniref:response regulator n=1 Tax=Pelagicoccus sp. SDUM812002 TaxID=3041266 RepID=UPI00280CDDA1|nr:response regulator [Pelagicoccus sp. SDUM812002]MDQ8187600.1 response regulator [Pelagicoccus sp. SDUM812002]